MLSPILIYLCIERLFSQERTKQLVLTGSLGAILVALQPLNWGRVSWGKDYFGVAPPKLEEARRSIVLMTGFDPIAYLVPAFPPSVQFLRIQSNLFVPSDSQIGFNKLISRILGEHSGPIYVLFRSSERELTREALAAYGLKLQALRCEDLKPRIETASWPLRFCLIERTAFPTNT